MRTKILAAAFMATALSGCVVGPPAPYYGGTAPYYGTAYAPAYVGVYGGGYYRPYGYQRIHSGYNNGYWHQQRAAQGANHGGAHAAGGHAGGGHGR